MHGSSQNIPNISITNAVSSTAALNATARSSATSSPSTVNPLQFLSQFSQAYGQTAANSVQDSDGSISFSKVQSIVNSQSDNSSGTAGSGTITASGADSPTLLAMMTEMDTNDNSATPNAYQKMGTNAYQQSNNLIPSFPGSQGATNAMPIPSSLLI